MKVNLNGKKYNAEVVKPTRILKEEWTPLGVVITMKCKLRLTRIAKTTKASK